MVIDENISKALHQSEERYRILVENSPFCIHSIEKDGSISSMNPAGLKMLGEDSEDNVCGLSYMDLVGDKDKVRINKLMMEAFEGKTSFFDFDVEVNGERIYFKSNFVPIYSELGFVEKLMGVTQDVTQLKLAEKEKLRAELTKEINIELRKEIEGRKKVEEELMKSIKEKKVLLKEIHHRVKNNLQLVSSLLSIQSISVDNDVFSNAIRKSQDRIRSMALVHENLYQSKTLSEIDIVKYINTLTLNKAKELGSDNKKLIFSNNIKQVNFEIEQMMPIGLIINELITNSSKYAVNSENIVHITISLQQNANNKFILSYNDKGKGFSKEALNNKYKGLGMELIDGFVSQLDGEMTIDSRDTGVYYTIEFNV